MTIQPTRHECHACYPLQAGQPGIQPVVGNTHDTHVEQVVSSFQKILRGSQLTWYFAPLGLATRSRITHVESATFYSVRALKVVHGSNISAEDR